MAIEADGQWTPDQIPDLVGYTAVVTGASSGIGLITARYLAVHGAQVLMAGREKTAIDRAMNIVRQSVPHALLEAVVFDLSDLSQVHEAATSLATSKIIDLVINNAAVMNLPSRIRTVDGLEMTMATNYLGHFAFNALIWPAILRAHKARVITVSAIAATWKRAKLSDPMSAKRYRPMSAYAKSKRAGVEYAIELARRVAGTSVESIAVHPGAAMTNLQRHSSGTVDRYLMPYVERYMMGSPDGAAWPILFAATSPDAHNGQFLGPASRDQTQGNPVSAPMPEGADDPSEGARLWRWSERTTGVRFEP